MKLNFNLKSSLYALALLAGMSACTSETEFQNNEGDGQLTSESGIRFVIQTPSPDAIVTRTVAGDALENEVKTMSLYIFAKNDKAAGDGDDQYTLLKKKEGITFETSGTPGTSGTNNSGSLSYTEPITADMIGRQVKMLLVANDKVDDASATVSATTLQDFKLLAATAVATDNGSADAVSGNIFAANSGSATGLVMSAIAYSGDTEGQNEAVVLTPLGVDMKANFQRIVARIDLIHAIPNMTLTGVKVLKAPSKGYLFPQAAPAAPADASTVTLLPTSGYDTQLSTGITYDAVTTDKNTLKHVFYLYEKANGAADCVTVEISYTLKMGNWEKPGKLDVKFQKSANDGSDYVNTVRNTLYTIQMGDGSEATDVNNVTTLTVKDWDLEDEIDESFTPNDDTHSEVITDLTQAQIGDYYLSDGTLRRSNYQFTPAEKAKVIGVVFQTDPDRIGEAEKQALGGTAHGLVMSVKLANDGKGCEWKNVDEDETGLTDMATVADAYKDISGLANYQKVKETDGDFTSHPAFKAVAEFKVEAPVKSTGWFLPSSGQLWDLAANLGKLSTYLEDKKDSQENYLELQYTANAGTKADIESIPVEDSYATNNINNYLLPLGSYSDLILADSDIFWSSTNYVGAVARFTRFLTSCFHFGFYNYTSLYCVRPILAF